MQVSKDTFLQLFKVLKTKKSFRKWDIARDANCNISIRSPFAPSSWVGAEITGSTVPVPWRFSWWQVLLVSLIPTYLPARRFSVTWSFFFQSHYGHESQLSEFTSACLARSLAWCFYFRGACPLFFDFGCLFNRSLWSPVNGFSERRWSTANVGVHSCIICNCKASSISCKLQVLWFCDSKTLGFVVSLPSNKLRC